ncbi:MAG: amino acid ABC transporter substrate-binding protein [Alphaproteobacteria bacterium]|nr:amino acid ABC transporter substrate-binding protein [Alphaproteobacteria bacterium]
MFRCFAVAAATVMLVSTAAAGTLDRIRESGVLKIGYRHDAQPFSFKNKIGEPAGYTVGLCRAVAESIKTTTGLTALAVEYIPVTTEDRFEAVTAGKVDLLCGATTATLSRRELVDFSIPVFVDGASVLLRADGPQTFGDLDGKKVGVRAATTTEEALRNTVRDLGINVETVTVEDHHDGLDKLLKNEISAYFADRAILFFLAAESGNADKLKLSKQQFTYEPYALALRRRVSDFRLSVDRALSSLYRSGKIVTIFASAFGAGAKPSGELRTLYRVSALPE